VSISEKTNFINDIIKKYKSNVSNVFFITGNYNDYYIDDEYNDRIIDLIQKELGSKLKLINQVVFDCSNSLSALIQITESKDYNLIIVKNSEYIINQRYVDTFGVTTILNLVNVLTSDYFRSRDVLIIFLLSDLSSLSHAFKRSELRSEIIKIPYPNQDLRLRFARTLFDRISEDKRKGMKFEVEITPEQLMKLTHGMSLYNMEDIYLYAKYEQKLNKQIIKNRKEEILKNEFDDVLEIIDDCEFRLKDYAGNEALKEYVNEVIVAGFNTGIYDIFPKGILLLGSPGVGKTFLAKCIAGESSVPYIELKMSKLLSKWVGESESKLSKALSGIASIGNCVVLLDEIDQILKRDNGDANPVRGNFFSTFLSFLNDSTRGILWFGTTNRYEIIDSALKRSGRFDTKIALLPPDKNERVELIKLNLYKKLSKEEIFEELNFEELAEKSFGMSHADIEVLINKAWELKRRKEVRHGINIKFTQELILTALKYIKYDHSDEVMKMIKSAIENATDLELVNMNWINEMRERTKAKEFK
jgi:transitional endoplasmic reticulum ATPase